MILGCLETCDRENDRENAWFSAWYLVRGTCCVDPYTADDC